MTASAAPRWLLIDDHQLFLDSLCGVIERARPEVELRTVSSAPMLAPVLDGWQPNLVVLDWSVPDLDVVPWAALWAAATPPIPVLVVSGVTELSEIVSALDAGVCGFVGKSEPVTTLLTALEAVETGQMWLSAERARSVAMFRQQRRGPQLSSRQHEVLGLMAQGHSNVQIGVTLSIQPATVKTHVAAVLAALGARNRAEAVYRARANGLLD